MLEQTKVTVTGSAPCFTRFPARCVNECNQYARSIETFWQIIMMYSTSMWATSVYYVLQLQVLLAKHWMTLVTMLAENILQMFLLFSAQDVQTCVYKVLIDLALCTTVYWSICPPHCALEIHGQMHCSVLVCATMASLTWCLGSLDYSVHTQSGPVHNVITHGQAALKKNQTCQSCSGALGINSTMQVISQWLSRHLHETHAAN